MNGKMVIYLSTGKILSEMTLLETDGEIHHFIDRYGIDYLIRESAIIATAHYPAKRSEPKRSEQP